MNIWSDFTVFVTFWGCWRSWAVAADDRSKFNFISFNPLLWITLRIFWQRFQFR